MAKRTSPTRCPYLHMREFAHSVGAFKEWTEDRRRGLLGDCVTAINSIRAIAVAAATSVEDFRKLGEPEQTMLQDPFFSCFQEVVRGVAINAHFERESYQAHMVFSRQDEFGPLARKLWHAMTRYIDVKERMGSLKFEDMRAAPGLQAADLLAYEFRHFYHLRKNKPSESTRWALREIVRNQRIVHGSRMLKYLPGWYLQLQASGAFDQVMARLWSDPRTLTRVLSDMVPTIL